MRYLLVFFLFFTIFPSSVEAQLYFSHRNTYSYPACIFSNIICRENDCFVSGVLAYPESSFYPVKPFHLKISTNSEIIDSSVITGVKNKDYWSAPYGYDAFKWDKNNQFASTGHTNSFDTINSMKIMFLVINTDLQSFIVKEFYDTAGNQFSSGRCVLSENSSWYILASVQDTFYNGQVLILKTDSAGNLLWKKYYGIPVLRDDPGTMLALSDDKFLIGYARNNLSQWTGIGLLQTNSRVMMIDSAGTVLKEWQDNTDSTFVPRSLIATKDGGYVFVTDLKMNNFTSYLKTRPVIVKLDSQLNKVWAKPYGVTEQNFYSQLYHVQELTDGSLLASGNVSAIDSVSLHTAGWLIKFAANGDSLWSRSYSGVYSAYSQNSIYDFEVLSDGSIIGVGQSTDFMAQTQGQQGWIIRVDSMGCLIPGCDTLTATSIKENEDDLVGIKVYPNPSSDVVYILLKSDEVVNNLSFAIFDNTGRKVAGEQNAVLDQTYLLNVSAYTSGTYFVVLSSGSRLLRTVPFVKN
jgi:hypothetical protein